MRRYADKLTQPAVCSEAKVGYEKNRAKSGESESKASDRNTETETERNRKGKRKKKERGGEVSRTYGT